MNANSTFLHDFQAKPVYGGWLCLAPEGTDFANPMQRSRVGHDYTKLKHTFYFIHLYHDFLLKKNGAVLILFVLCVNTEMAAPLLYSV